MSFSDNAKTALRALIGLAIALSAGYVGYVATQTGKACALDHKVLAGVGVGIFFGGYVIAPGLFTASGKGVISLLGSLITALKGGGSPPSP